MGSWSFRTNGWHRELFRGAITPADAAGPASLSAPWLSDAQWDAAFSAGGYAPAVAAALLRATSCGQHRAIAPTGDDPPSTDPLAPAAAAIVIVNAGGSGGSMGERCGDRSRARAWRGLVGVPPKAPIDPTRRPPWRRLSVNGGLRRAGLTRFGTAGPHAQQGPEGARGSCWRGSRKRSPVVERPNATRSVRAGTHPEVRHRVFHDQRRHARGQQSVRAERACGLPMLANPDKKVAIAPTR